MCYYEHDAFCEPYPYYVEHLCYCWSSTTLPKSQEITRWEQPEVKRPKVKDLNLTADRSDPNIVESRRFFCVQFGFKNLTYISVMNFHILIFVSKYGNGCIYICLVFVCFYHILYPP